MSLTAQLLAAMALDLLLGDPRWAPHPVTFIARLAAWLESGTRRLISNEYAAGACTWLLTLGVTLGAAFLLLYGLTQLHPLAGDLAAVLLLYTCLATRSLCDHGLAVFRALRDDDLPLARQRVGMIVGRDTENLEKAGVTRATVESIAENTVDGITAPLFFAFIAGPMGAIAYKTINTMDSLFGYRNARYQRFGWVPARADDVANWIPARLTALLMPLAAALLGMRAWACFRVMVRDRLKHPSPNAAHCEAAVAGALGVQLGGGGWYGGVFSAKPHLGDAGETLAPHHITRCIRLVLLTTLLFFGAGLAALTLYG